MPLLSTSFALLLLATAVAWWLTRRTRFAGAVLLTSGLVFFAWRPITGERSVLAFVPLAVFALSAAITVFGVREIVKVPVKERGRKLWLPVSALVILLTCAKVADASWTSSSFLHLALPIGISYYVLRAIAALVESARGTLRDPKPLEVAGFMGFAPLLTIGPIERASSFVQQWRSSPSLRETWALASQGIGRIIEGLFKIWVVCKVLEPYAKPFQDAARTDSFQQSAYSPWIALYTYSLYLYVNFSAASDLAIGASRFFGVKVSENFDIPYARPNISEFWRAWHISLSTWLRDFLFFPLGKRLPRDAAPIVAPLLVMSLCGLWHGLTVPFLIWGFLHGAGLAVHQMWTKARRANEGLDKVSSSIVARTFFSILTAHFVALTWVFFASSDLTQAMLALRLLFTPAPGTLTILAYGAAVVGLWSFVPGIRDWLRRKAGEEAPSIPQHLASLWRSHVDVICLLILVARLLLSRSQPEGAFIYQGF